jgi:hypothetical protein
MTPWRAGRGQYIAMTPAEHDEATRRRRVENWRRRQPATWRTNPDGRHREQTRGKTAQLTPVGRKLLGLDSWD